MSEAYQPPPWDSDPRQDRRAKRYWQETLIVVAGVFTMWTLFVMLFHAFIDAMI